MSNPAFKFDHVHIISKDPEASANWYAEMFGATIAANTMARGAPQIFVDLGGMTILVRGQRPGEDPAAARPICEYADFSSHNAWAPTISASCTKAISKRSAPSCAARV
jgi:catechol 2,3-dioxygenase-like lactoylglutathione lyase family enzyme